MPAKRPRKTVPRKRTRAAQKSATRERIVAAALALFGAQGFDATTTKAIAKRARVSEGTIFNYFQTKEDIALHFFETEVDHAIASVRRNARLANAPLEEKLFALLDAQMRYLAPYEQFIGAAFVQSLKPASALAASAQAFAVRQRYLSFVDELIGESLPAKRINAMRWLAPEVFWFYYVGVLLFWLNDTSRAKERTLAMIDRSLRIGVGVLTRGTI